MNRLIFRVVTLWIAFTVCSQLVAQTESSVMKYANVDVLVAFYTNTAGGQISESDVQRLKNGIELSREFYWRNSGCLLNLTLSYLELTEFKPKKFFPEDGLLWPKYVEDDFKKAGVTPGQYGIILLIYTPLEGGGNYGGMKILGDTGYSFFRFPCKSTVLYPGEKPDVDYKATWLFTHELQHSLDLVCYQNSGAETMWHGDRPLDHAIQSGEQFSYQAEIFRQFTDYRRIRSPWGKVETSSDFDRDGVPDRDARVPLDEARFGSDSTRSDSDADGRDDLSELMAGIYAGSDPNAADTDRDGIRDSHDQYPLHPIHPRIPEITPYLDGDWSTWFPVCNALSFASSKFLMGNPLHVDFYMNWDQDFIYIGCEMNAPAELHLDLDMMNDGWWRGKDNYRLAVDPFSKRFSQIRVMDATDKTRAYRDSLGNGPYEMWDDDLQYIERFGKILDESSVELITQAAEDNFTIHIKIPKNERIGFIPQKNRTIGIRVYFTAPEIGAVNSWATLFDQYEFFDVSLE